MVLIIRNQTSEAKPEVISARVNIFVTNIRNREEVWRARREFFSGDFPVSTLVEVSALAAPEMNVEIEAEGVLDSSAGV